MTENDRFDREGIHFPKEVNSLLPHLHNSLNVNTKLEVVIKNAT